MFKCGQSVDCICGHDCDILRCEDCGRSSLMCSCDLEEDEFDDEIEAEEGVACTCCQVHQYPHLLNPNEREG